jgi:hypothetical protein
MANAGPEPFTNWFLSIGEDLFVVGLGVLALNYPRRGHRRHRGSADASVRRIAARVDAARKSACFAVAAVRRCRRLHEPRH